MPDVSLTITLPDLEAYALAMVIASLGPEQHEHAYHSWLNHWKATDAYSPAEEVNMSNLMGDAADKLYAALADAGFDVLSRMGPRS